VNLYESAVSFYALNGQSVVSFFEDQTRERTCECFERIREQNPVVRILPVLDNHFAHTCKYTRKSAHQLGIDFIFLPVDPPDLNPIEQVWKQLKWEASPLIVESAAEFCALVKDLFEELTSRLSFARS